MLYPDQTCMAIFKPSCWKPVGGSHFRLQFKCSDEVLAAFNNKGVLSSSSIISNGIVLILVYNDGAMMEGTQTAAPANNLT